MTTIQNIPEEILLTIFSNLSGQDLIQCQYVCRSWFIPGRVKFLNRKVILTNTTKNKRFSAAINRNPNPRFLAAVREVETSYTNVSHVNNSVLNNILFRFPNLESVTIGESLVHKFNDNVCEKFLLCCPKLSELRICTRLSFVYLEELENVRLLLTELDLQSGEIDDIEQFVASFPRLKSLHTHSQLDTFESLLPVLAQSSSLKSIKFKQFQNGPDHFLEKYLQSKSQDEQTRLFREDLTNQNPGHKLHSIPV